MSKKKKMSKKVEKFLEDAKARQQAKEKAYRAMYGGGIVGLDKTHYPAFHKVWADLAREMGHNPLIQPPILYKPSEPPEAYRTGQEFRQYNLPRIQNPFRLGTDEWENFSRGYDNLDPLY